MSLLAKRAMAAGEISPSLYARTDITKYALGLKTLKNSTVRKFGGTRSRSGFKKVKKLSSSFFTSRLIDWVFNDEQAYVIELNHYGAYFYRDGRPVLIDPDEIETLDGSGGASPLEVTITGHSYLNDEGVFIFGMDGIIPEGLYIVRNPTANTFTLEDEEGNDLYWLGNTYTVPAGTSQLGYAYALGSPYPASDIMDVRYVQSGDVMIMTHPSYPIHELIRTGPDHWNWTFSPMTIGPAVTTPAAPVAAPAGGVFDPSFYITAVNELGEESLASPYSGTANTGGNFQVTWAPVSGASYYNLYSDKTPGYGGSPAGGPALIATTKATYFYDNWATAATILVDGESRSTTARNPFGSVNNYPKACGIFEQRLFVGFTNNNTELIASSRIGSLRNFELNVPITDQQTVEFSMAGRQVNSVQHLLDLAKLLIFTTSGEHTANAAPITPTDIQLRQEDYNGSSDLKPLIVDGSAVYVQARGNIIRDIGFQFESDGYRGNDLTIYNFHLLEGYEIVDWCYQKTPDQVIWIVRNDGVMLSLTYIKDQLILGWARHELSDGRILRVTSIPEGNHDTLYALIQRTVDGATVNTIEKFVDRFFLDDEIDFVGMDGAVTLDGRHDITNSFFNLTITGGTNWDNTESLTVTAGSDIFFGDDDLGNELHFYNADGSLAFKMDITAVNGASTVATATPDRTIPVAFRSVATANWARAFSYVRGLFHLEGKNVSIFGDRYVDASPYNADYDLVTVTNGAIDLPTPRTVVHIGLPFLVDIETLDIDISGPSSVATKMKQVNEVTVQLEKSRGLWIGAKAPSDDSVDALENLTELKLREEEGYDEEVRLLTGKATVAILPEWNSNGRVFIRQVDPLPCAVLAIFPEGNFPFGGG